MTIEYQKSTRSRAIICADCGAHGPMLCDPVSAEPARELREAASREGWTRRQGRDYCPRCSGAAA